MNYDDHSTDDVRSRNSDGFGTGRNRYLHTSNVYPNMAVKCFTTTVESRMATPLLSQRPGSAPRDIFTRLQLVLRRVLELEHLRLDIYCDVSLVLLPVRYGVFRDTCDDCAVLGLCAIFLEIEESVLGSLVDSQGSGSLATYLHTRCLSPRRAVGLRTKLPVRI
jgi:hypothetical protein